ncbi:hypothetical protein [Pseudomonas panipatensis]|uniref:Uncharacterized protein n=1 Tax=Pseudomonas panipatensis TaxID=428992 RepID=A0A1G8LGW5_9PSED|nr:hypothetical protein [Pseudomonas panipatensis]SDI54717.1 hypothetical protein SAMN05216272_111137 [Pseudomonas panipatensis]SMP74953.1 hypothetical protein SAMN06295951_11363 [Pseudomonas panipatensis]
MLTSYRERRSRAAFGNAQLAYDLASDPLWDQPDPEPDDEPEDTSDDQQNREGLEADQA